MNGLRRVSLVALAFLLGTILRISDAFTIRSLQSLPSPLGRSSNNVVETTGAARESKQLLHPLASSFVPSCFITTKCSLFAIGSKEGWHVDRTSDVSTWKARIRTTIERAVDTLGPAGLRDGSHAPLVAQGSGLKKVIIIGGLMIFMKWFRAKFLLKGQSGFMEYQPNWNHVVTCKEEEKNLHAWTCKNCGSTMFVAKGREFRFHNRFTKCFNCGATGEDNFYDRREEVMEEVDDSDQFAYESPYKYSMSERKRKKLLEKMEKEKAELEAKEKEEKLKDSEAETANTELESGGEDNVAKTKDSLETSAELDASALPAMDENTDTNPKAVTPKKGSQPEKEASDVVDILDME